MLGKGVKAAPPISSADSGEGIFSPTTAEVPRVLIACAFKTLEESPAWLIQSKVHYSKPWRIRTRNRKEKFTGSDKIQLLSFEKYLALRQMIGKLRLSNNRARDWLPHVYQQLLDFFLGRENPDFHKWPQKSWNSLWMPHSGGWQVSPRCTKLKCKFGKRTHELQEVAARQSHKQARATATRKKVQRSNKPQSSTRLTGRQLRYVQLIFFVFSPSSLLSKTF